MDNNVSYLNIIDIIERKFLYNFWLGINHYYSEQSKFKYDTYL